MIPCSHPGCGKLISQKSGKCWAHRNMKRNPGKCSISDCPRDSAPDRNRCWYHAKKGTAWVRNLDACRKHKQEVRAKEELRVQKHDRERLARILAQKALLSTLNRGL